MVFGELDWSPGVIEQCIGRVYRDGQSEPVMAYYLIAEDGSDPIMADVLGVKRGQIEGVRDPHGALIEQLDTESGNVKRLADAYLTRLGINAVPHADVPAMTAPQRSEVASDEETARKLA